MTIRVFVTIDTEEDTWNNYSTVENPVKNITRLPDLQSVMDKYGALPTYLINYPVASDPYAISFFGNLSANDKCEIGAHCHPWNTPPYEETINTQNSFMCNLPYDLQFEKLNTLTSIIQQNIGYRPKSFRAGRWGFSAGTARALFDFGYKIDTSVTPLMDWRNHQGPNFTKEKLGIYRLGKSDLFQNHNGGNLIEVTPTIGFLQKNYRSGSWIRRLIKAYPLSRLHLSGILDRLSLLNFRWLSPELTTGSDMIRLSEAFINEGYKYLNMTFHSTTLLPGKNPFVRNNDDLRNFVGRIEYFFEYVIREGYNFSRLSDILDHQEIC